MSATSLSVLATTQETWITEQLVDSFFDAMDVTMSALKNAAGRGNVDGGEHLSWGVETAQVGTATFTTAGGTFASATAEFARKANLDWKFPGLSPKRDAPDFSVFNKGKARVINLAKGWHDNTKKSLKELLGASVWANTDPAVATNDWVSLANAIHPTADYAGLTVGAVPTWASLYLDLNGSEWTISIVEQIINELRGVRGVTGKITCYCGLARYNALAREAGAAVRHQNVKSGTKTLLNVPTFDISDVTITLDRFLNNTAANGAFAATDPRGVAGSRKAYFVVDEHLVLAPAPADDRKGFKTIDEFIQVGEVTDLVHVTRENAYQFNMQAPSSLAYLNRKQSAVISRIGA